MLGRFNLKCRYNLAQFSVDIWWLDIHIMQQLDRFTNVIFGGWIFTRRSDRFTNVAAPSSQSGHTYSPRQQVTISQTPRSLARNLLAFKLWLVALEFFMHHEHQNSFINFYLHNVHNEEFEKRTHAGYLYNIVVVTKVPMIERQEAKWLTKVQEKASSELQLLFCLTYYLPITMSAYILFWPNFDKNLGNL